MEPMEKTDSRADAAVGRTVRRLVLGAVLMFGFGFALVPLYQVFCDITGLNGKTDGQRYAYRPDAVAVDTEREVTVQFIAFNGRGLAWEFHPVQNKISVHPGEVINTAYFARNTGGRAMIAQAVPSVSPGLAAAHLKKMECFCFERQELAAGASRDMGLKFYLDPDIPPDIRTVTLSYTLYEVSEAGLGNL